MKTTLNVPAWANNANKQAQARKAYEQRKEELERKQAREGAIVLAIFIASILIVAWCNGHL